MKSRPGVMIYLDIRNNLSLYSDEEVGQLFRAILDYVETGVLPEFDDRGMLTLWNDVKAKIDRDGEKYESTCKKRSYAAYCKNERGKGNEPLEYEAWVRETDFDSIL